MNRKYTKFIIVLIAIASTVTVGFWLWRHSDIQADSTAPIQSEHRPTQNTRDDLASLFNDIGSEGTMVIRDIESNNTITVNVNRASNAYIPTSTFKIAHSLIALEEKAVKDVDTILPGPHAPRIIEGESVLSPLCEKDISLRDAFRLSCVTVYQEIARQIPKPKYEQYLRQLNYGNADISKAEVDQFWLEGSLAITPNEYVDFLEAFYKDKLPFTQQTMTAVKDIMMSEQTSKYTLRSKTGRAPVERGPNIGWWVGWIESSDGKTTLFALNMDIRNSSQMQEREKIGKEILRRLGRL